MERQRSWRWRLAGELRERARDKDPSDGFDQSGSFLQPPVILDINQLMKLTTAALGSRLEAAGLKDPWLLARRNIFEHPIISLGIILDKAPLPNFLREAASQETVLLANSLLTLLTARVKLHVTKLTEVNAIFSGYFEHFDGQTKRVSVNQWLKETHHPQSGRVIRPNCQISVREIIGRTSGGRAIAGNDLRVRCGLRFGGWLSDNKWRVSIDSGIPAAKGNQRPLLKSIGSITQAYNESRKYPESFYYLQDTDTINTFHFEDSSTKTVKPGRSAFKFFIFNNCLNLVFRQLART